jgi:hypothetical protein
MKFQLLKKVRVIETEQAAIVVCVYQAYGRTRYRLKMQDGTFRQAWESQVMKFQRRQLE